MQHLIKNISAELELNEAHAVNAVRLLVDEECTIPFVARYRKELTGSMDEVVLRNLRERYQYMVELETTKARYLKVIEEQAKNNPAIAKKLPQLKEQFLKCSAKHELEDLYLPFKPKRRTKASIAKDKGLEPLLDGIYESAGKIDNLMAFAQEFIDQHKPQVASADEALAGATDILAERVNETAEYRALVRQLSFDTGMLVAKKAAEKAVEVVEEANKNSKKKQLGKFDNYFDYKEPVKNAISHRVLAVRRGEAEKVLQLSIETDTDMILAELTNKALGDAGQCTEHVREWVTTAVQTSYKRLMNHSIETEIRLNLKTKAEEGAIKVFSTNLENLLLLPPIPGKVVLGIDPGIRTGSKLAVVSATGKLLHHDTIYPILNKPDHNKSVEAINTIAKMIEKYKVGCVALGNGTGSKEVDQLVILALKNNNLKDTKRAIVNEAGASVYSTDEVAREEFPNLDPTIRSAISIARRLQDPLAELVKIDPRSIGVGQYQHDCNVIKLTKSLKDTVESCVNRVGVNINTASGQLLSYVSGIGPSLAKNIVEHRNEHGAFSSRQDLIKVKGLGQKVYQQSAGFLRVPDSENPLDNSAVHPEQYPVVETIAQDLQMKVADLVGKHDVIKNLALEKYVDESCGLPTLLDISKELEKPGRDPREDGSRLTFSDDVTTMEDLEIDMKLKGTVSNVTDFGAFVDIGVHQDGLVHISELSDEFVSDPSQVVSVGDILDVRVIQVDLQRKRISLSCKKKQQTPAQQKNSNSQESTRRPFGQQKGPFKNKDGNKQQRNNRNNKPRKNFVPSKKHSLNDLLDKFNNK